MRLTVNRQASTAKWLPWVCLLCINSHFIVPLWGLAYFTTMLVWFAYYCAIKQRRKKNILMFSPCCSVKWSSGMTGWCTGSHTHLFQFFSIPWLCVSRGNLRGSSCSFRYQQLERRQKAAHHHESLSLFFSVSLSLYQSKTMTKVFTEPEMVLTKWLLVIVSRVESQLCTLTSGWPVRERQNMSNICLLSPHYCASRSIQGRSGSVQP